MDIAVSEKIGSPVFFAQFGGSLSITPNGDRQTYHTLI
jgi:hypothetical protein